MSAEELAAISRMSVTFQRQWLDHVAHFRSYVPQLGDQVVYFPEGHQEFLSVHPSASAPPYQSWPPLWGMVKCRVVRLSYAFPPTDGGGASGTLPAIVTKLELRMEAVALPPETEAERLLTNAAGGTADANYTDLPPHARRQAGGGLVWRLPRAARRHGLFEVEFFPSNVPDFLVLAARLEAGLRNAWQVGDKIQAAYWVDVQPKPARSRTNKHGDEDSASASAVPSHSDLAAGAPCTVMTDELGTRELVMYGLAMIHALCLWVLHLTCCVALAVWCLCATGMRARCDRYDPMPSSATAHGRLWRCYGRQVALI